MRASAAKGALRSPPSSSPEGAPEWMVSYADMITIIMAFFVVLYASTSTSGTKDKGGKAGSKPQGGKEATYGKLLMEEGFPGKDDTDDRLQRVIESLYHRFGPEWTLSNCWGGGAANVRRPASTNVEVQVPAMENRPAKRIRGLGKENASVIFAPKPRENLVAGGRVFFPDDSTSLEPAQKQQLDTVVEDLAGKMQRVEIRGHTERGHAASDKANPWDTAYARSRAVAAYLIEKGIDPKRIRLAVAADNEPLRASSDPLQRRQNSRVDVQLLNEWVRKGPPLPASVSGSVAEPGDGASPKADSTGAPSP